MKLSFATIVLTLAAAVPAAAQTNYYYGGQQQPGYTDTRPNEAPIYGIPGAGGYMTQTPGQTPGQSPMYGTPNGVGGYGVGGYGVGGAPTQTPPGYTNRQGR